MTGWITLLPGAVCHRLGVFFGWCRGLDAVTLVHQSVGAGVSRLRVHLVLSGFAPDDAGILMLARRHPTQPNTCSHLDNWP